MKTTTCLIAALALAALFAAPVRADIDTGEEGTIAQRPIDPFLPLIQPPKEVVEIVKKAPDIVLPAPVQIIPPVQFAVTAVAVDGENRVAVIEFEGQTYIVQKGSKVPETGTPAIVVREVSEEKVVVDDTRRAMLVTKQIAE